MQAGFTYTLGDNLENLTLTGTDDINATGNTLNNTLTGNAGVNVLQGGAGNDIYAVGVGDTVIEDIGQGTDTVQAGFAYTLGDNLENLTLTGSGAIDATGNELNNTLTGNSGVNVLAGGAGNDTYVVGVGDTVIEGVGQGTDTVQASVSFTLGDNVENLTLTGSGAINATGNELDNTLTGNSGANVLAGGAGNDTYVVGVGDTVIEGMNQGTDTVQSSVSFMLGDNVENLTLTGSSAIEATGNALDNTLTGNSGANVLAGGAGNDTYVVGAGDTVIEGTNQGTDTVQSSVTFTLGDNVENLTLTGTGAINATGNTLANTLTGNSGANVLDGGAGNDSMSGGAGNDIYLVDAAGDAVTENANEGTDTVQSSISYALGDNVENLTLTGADNIDGTGNAVNNIITGNAGANVLQGGAGNDTYVVGAGDVVVEGIGEGTDTVQAAISYVLGDNVENLTLTGTDDIDATGNTLNNTLTGNAGNNVLDGGAGSDTLRGGAGDDTYVVETGDAVTESADQGNDTVLASISYTLGSNVENLTLTGSSNINGTGNTLDNILIGNAGNNTLSGGTGNDAMSGGSGNDTYVVEAAGDTVTENANEGIDTVQSEISYVLGANVENLTLTGSANIDATGNALDNTLTGNAGLNVLAGGDGNDTYVVGLGDTVTEAANHGTDTVQSAISYTLAANVENLTLTGTGAINATGNELDNTLTGNSGANVLDGGAGNDAMSGGSGNDIYVVDAAGDTVTETSAQGGTDMVQASVSFTLGANVENLTLTGTDDINATGNALANTLTGNAGVNILDGGAGNDIYVVGVGDTVVEGCRARHRHGAGRIQLRPGRQRREPDAEPAPTTSTLPAMPSPTRSPAMPVSTCSPAGPATTPTWWASAIPSSRASGRAPTRCRLASPTRWAIT